MLTPSGATGAAPTSLSQQSIASSLSWMSDPLSSYSRLQTAEGKSGNSTSATPRRFTPPSPDTRNLNGFFGGAEWNGVKVSRLSDSTKKDELELLFAFTSAVDDVRIIRTDTDKEERTKTAYVRFKSREAADQAQQFINNREVKGNTVSVEVVPRPQQSEIAKMAISSDPFSPDLHSQSPSSSDGLSTPAASSILGEYTTAASSIQRQFTSPVGSISGRSMNGIGKAESVGLTSPLGRINGVSDTDVHPAILSIEKLGLDDQPGLSSLNGINGTKPQSAYDQQPLMPPRGMSYHGPTLDSMSEDGMPGNDTFGAMADPLGAFSRPRRQTNPVQNRFGKLPPLSTTGMGGFSSASMSPMTAPPIGAPQITSPLALNSPAANWPATKPYYNNFPITSHPPANPADQNPPCNTLYVGNLPAQTSEDELKALFCRQRGYKRMCFRTKPQGPMCFVEFEDTHYATKALTELYGRALSNSTKGGVRLSFSKNPLGVRSQPAGAANTAPKTPASAIPGPNAHGFPTPLRNPPGLPNPNQRQMTPLPSVGAEQTTQAPPGLFRSSTTPTPGFPTSAARLPPGLTTTGLATPTGMQGGYFGGSDVRSPMELRSAVDVREGMRSPPGVIGAIGNPPRS